MAVASLVSAGAVTGTIEAKAGEVYGPYPVTLKGWWGAEKNSVAYTGQMARHVIHDSLKSLSGKGNGSPNPELKKKMLSYYAGKDAFSFLHTYTDIDLEKIIKNIAKSHLCRK